MNSFVFTGSSLRTLREDLLRQGPKEAGAFLLCGRSAVSSGAHRLLVREIAIVPPEAYLVQESDRISVRPAFFAPLLKRARLEGWSLIFAHTHPFGRTIRFSPVDDEGERLLVPSLFGRAGNRPHGALVLGPTGFDARLWDSPVRVCDVGTLREVSRDLRVERKDELLPEFDESLDRSIRAFGASGQAVLRAMCVAVVGLGGVGSLVVEQLAHLGVGRLILLDPDRVESTNLNRLVGTTHADVGRAKASVAERLARAIRPETEVHAVQGSVLLERDALSLLSADFLIGCTDSHGSRAILNQLAYQHLIPVIDSGVQIHAAGGKAMAVAGRVQMLAPGLPCLVCQGLLDTEQVRRDLLTDAERARDRYIVGFAEPQPAVISLNGVVASLAVTMFLAATIGFPSPPRHQVYLAERGAVRPVESTADPKCVVCSLRGALGRGDLWPMPWRR
jgi:molybdopterin/thiamine biosynthesis adenylyltransferase